MSDTIRPTGQESPDGDGNSAGRVTSAATTSAATTSAVASNAGRIEAAPDGQAPRAEAAAVASATTERLAEARLYLCCDARETPEDLRRFARAAFAGGVDIIQVRDRSITTQQEMEAIGIVAEEAATAGALCAANDRADIAALTGVDVLHVGQDDLPPASVRRIAPNALLGMSTHSADQFRAAMADPDLAYYCVGPVWATPTKPGRPGVGVDLVRQAAVEAEQAGSDRPWFAIGGIDAHTVDEVVEAGARRIVVVRAITQADDPEAAARALRSRLPR